MKIIKKIFEEGKWLTAEEIDHLQQDPSQAQSLATNWERHGCVFSVSYDGKNYYPLYQFNSLYQPLPVIKGILDAYGSYVDAWAVAAWFHFPNCWITGEDSGGAVPVSPKDALHRCKELINAARNHKGTYVA